MIKKSIWSFVITVFALLLVTSTKISAKEELFAPATTSNASGDVVGSIHLYDDYSVKVLYKYRLKDLSVKVCEDDECQELAPKGQTYLNNAPYEDMGVWEKSLSEYLVAGEEKREYVVAVSADFKMSVNSVAANECTFTETIVIDPASSNKENDKGEEVLTSLDKVVNVCNTWIIPGLYVILAAVLIIKGVLLSIDLVKHADDSAIRKEKLKAFTFLAVALLLAAALNTGVGFLTGLFG